jgi:hypothetical protein
MQKILDDKEEQRVKGLKTVDIPTSFFKGNVQMDKSNLPMDFSPELHTQFIDEVMGDIPEKMRGFAKNIELTNNLGKDADVLAVANFNPRTNRIKINAINDEVEFKATLIHELGHTYFKELTPEQKNTWKEATEKPLTRYTGQFDQMILNKFSSNPKLEIKKKAKQAFSELYQNEQFAEFTRIKFSKKGRGNPGSSLEVLISDQEIEQVDKVFNKL